jgi:CRISPR/Cas system-associated protein Cas10 (large subunit of type III CRISPR-Cas system)
VKIILLELETESKEVEDADEAGKFMPDYNLINCFEEFDEYTTWKRSFRHLDFVAELYFLVREDRLEMKKKQLFLIGSWRSEAKK